MKKIYFITLIILSITMLFLPLAAGLRENTQNKLPTFMGTDDLTELEKTDTVRVYRSQTGEIKTMPLEDYLFSVVSAEMPALYEVEALKAQTVAAYTYLLCKMNSSNGEYDITDDSSIDQAFADIEAVRAKWGEKADEYEGKIRSAVKSVLYEQITYDKKPILAVYHAISGGKTENAAEVWGGSYSYLTSVDSEGDKLSPNYLSSATFSADELKEKLKELVVLSGEADGWVGEISRTEAGTVKHIKICGTEISGDKTREALGLRSANFDVAFLEGAFTFTVRGYGHGVGMSQYGAHYMAMQGKTYKEILLHYYKGCEIE